MINIPPLKPGTEIKTERLPDISQIWKPGQLLHATVEKGNENLDRILLRIGSRLFEARNPLPLKTGEQLQLLVKSLGEKPLLSIQTRVDITSLAADKLRSVIAQQSNPAQLVHTIQQLLNRGHLPPTLQQPLQQFIRQLPEISEILQPQQLTRLIKSSGVFLEPALIARPAQDAQQAVQDTPLSRDIKGQLLRITAALQQELPMPPARIGDSQQLQKTVQDFIRGDTTLQQLVRSLSSLLPREHMQQLLQFVSGTKLPQPSLPQELLPLFMQLVANIKQQPRAQTLNETLVRLLQNAQDLQELKASVEQTLARITSQQLTPLTRDADNPLLLLFGLIFRDREITYLVDFRIEQEPPSPDKQQDQWSVTLSFNFPEIGALQCQLHLAGDRLAATFHAEQITTAGKIQQHLPLLHSALEKTGLHVTRLDVTQQAIKPARDIPVDIHILDEKV